MDSLPVSPIEELNAAIQSHNPFRKTGIVKDQDVWGKGFPDVATLNAHASNAVFQAIERVRTSPSSQDKVTSLAFTASMGVGKSHVISRIRHRLQADGSALFVYASVNKYTDLNLINYQFQQTLADSLRQIGSQGVMQWQEVATAKVNEAEKARKPDAKALSPEQLVKNFDRVYAQQLAKNQKNLIDVLFEKVFKNKPNADPYIVRAILWTLSEKQSSFAIRWLSGQPIDNAKADRLGLPPNSLKTNKDREAEALSAVREILNFVSGYKPVVICFDEIDVRNECTDSGLTTPEVIADLVKRLYDTLHQSELSQGVVLLTVMLPDTWQQTVKQMGGGTLDRVIAEPSLNKKPIELQPIDGKSMVDLVTLWLKEFYQQRNLNPPRWIYPFEESQLIEYGKKERPSVRKALEWCAENFKIDKEPLPEDPLERFELAFKTEGKAVTVDDLENNSLLADTLSFGFQTLKGQTVGKVTVDDVAEIKPKARNAGWINFKVVGTEDGKVVKIGVTVIQTAQSSLVAGLRRLCNYSKFDLTRGCLVRSKSKIETIKKNSEASKWLTYLISDMKGEIVDLIEEQVIPLLAVHSVYQKRDKYELNEEQVLNFIYQNQLTFENPLLQEILSDPSGEIPTLEEDDILTELAAQTLGTAAEEDASLYEEFASLSSGDDTANEDDLTDLLNLGD
jgi:hypothetical protein